VEPGGTVVVLEAMKMEHVVALPAGGTVRRLAVRPGDTVRQGQLLATVEHGDAEHSHAAEVHDLKSIGAGNDDAASKDTTTAKKTSNTAGPIDPRVAGDLVAKLKALTRSDVDAFLAEFGVQRVRDLDAKHETAARAFIDQLLEKQAQPADVDPFA